MRFPTKNKLVVLIGEVVRDIAIGAGGLGSIPGPVKSLATAATFSSELRCSGAKQRRWAPPTVRRVLRRFD